MPTRTKLRAGIKSILKLAAPIGAANLAIVCSGTIDTIMAGQTSAEDLAGVALGIAVATWISISSCKSSKDHSKPRNEVDTSLKSPV